MLQRPIPASAKLVRLVEGILAKNAASGTPHSGGIPFDRDLVDIGMTSVDMVSLMLAVEAEFDLMIPESEMTPRNFQSISAIERLLGALPRGA